MGKPIVVKGPGHTPASDFSADPAAWAQWAEQTYAGAHVLFNYGDPFLWFSAACLGQQALEMFLKAALIQTGRRVAKDDVWGHDLVFLAHELEKTGVVFPQGFLDDLQKFNDLFKELRYPHPAIKVPDLSLMEGELLDTLVPTLRTFAN
jgi:HEPN domain-containing protein